MGSGNLTESESRIISNSTPVGDSHFASPASCVACKMHTNTQPVGMVPSRLHDWAGFDRFTAITSVISHQSKGSGLFDVQFGEADSFSAPRTHRRFQIQASGDRLDPSL